MVAAPVLDTGGDRTETLWCVGRQGDVYDELFLLTRPLTVPRPSASLGASQIHFRGRFDTSIESRVGSVGRRSWAFLPREDVRSFVQAVDT